MHEDGNPFFIGPHRFEASEDADGPRLDRRYELIPELGEQILGRYRLRLAVNLLGPTGSTRQWSLPDPVTVTVTDRRLVHVSETPLTLVAGEAGQPHPGPGRHRLVSGELRWQWPSRMELPQTGDGWPDELLVVCDSLRTIRQPALALRGAACEVAELARQVRRSVALFRLTRPELVELAPPERDGLMREILPAVFQAGVRVPLPGSLPVEFLSPDDYYLAGSRQTAARSAAEASFGRGDSAC